MSLFKRKKAGEEANTIPEAMDDITQTLLIPVKDEGEKTMCADAYETSQAEIASYTSIGTRKSQQDSICFDFGDFCTVCAVCDGMGGLTGGERASALAAHGVTRYLLEHAQAEDIPTEMGRAALRLNEEVKNLRDPANQKIEAGTTLTTVFLRNGKLFWCSIGDSHIYLYRDGTLEQLNIDHNFGAQLDQMALEGSITQDEALHHPQRAALTSYLGISELTLISGNRMPFQLRKGDVLIQCTDGLYRYLGGRPENLTTCDLVCHGVPSPGVWEDMARSLEARRQQPLQAVRFRNKVAGWKDSHFTAVYGDGTVDTAPLFRTEYGRAFGRALFLRPSCYRCPYASMTRVGDLTLGDFWGLRPDELPDQQEKGISLLLVNTPHGSHIFDQLPLAKQPFPPERAIAGNPRLASPIPLPPERTAFFAAYALEPFDQVRREFCRLPPLPVRAAGRLLSPEVKAAIRKKLK